MKKIAIVILNFNGEKDTIECLKSISKLSRDNYHLSVIIVDNGSDSEFVIQNSEFRINDLKIIKNSKNLGFAEGNNVGIEYALNNGSDYVLLLNNDTIVDKNLINELLKTAELNGKNGIIVPKIYFAPGSEFHKQRYKKEELGKVIWYAGGIIDWKNVLGFHRGVDEVDKGQFDNVEETEFASGCCMFVKKELFKKIGMFDNKYFLYYEDGDFSERAKKAGYKIIYTPKAYLWHKNAGSAGGSGSDLQDYYITRNRLLFGLKAPFRSKLALFKESLRLIINGRPWQRQGILDFYLAKFNKGTYKI
ncbi:MAG: glycosyltransferase family 2 protein [Actinobacteria bacterium]|nr:glycosyltransferase family 2 protein [Actinomycetota bacterium]